MTTSAQEAPTIEALRQWVYREARLIDEKRWEEWNDLFTEDGVYWVPASRGQPDPQSHVSIIYEGDMLRAVRLKRYSHPNAMSLQPQPWSVHVVSNVMLDQYDEGNGECTVNCRFIMIEYRRDQQYLYGGACTYTLVPDGDDWRMREKKVELVNCDGALDSIQLPF